jgi:hypothetical protein
MRPRTLALTIAAVAASAVATALLRLKRGGRSGERAAGTPRTWHCECGQAFRVAGTGRHRVYWRADAPDDDPVLSQRCPSCDRALPHEHEEVATPA